MLYFSSFEFTRKRIRNLFKNSKLSFSVYSKKNGNDLIHPCLYFGFWIKKREIKLTIFYLFIKFEAG